MQLALRILLDTHIALWAVVGSKRLATRAKELILDADEVFVSGRAGPIQLNGRLRRDRDMST